MALAWMFRFFKGELAEGFTDSDMDPTDFFLREFPRSHPLTRALNRGSFVWSVVPKSNACRMKLTPVA